MAVTVLERIVGETRREVDRRKRAEPLEKVREEALATAARRSFADSLVAAADGTSGVDFAIIAEVKKASPSKGLIREDFDPLAIATAYDRGGAAGISILTDEPFFQGRLEYLVEARRAVQAPVLRKDFIVDPYQVWESRRAGADALLLIAAALDDTTLRSLHELCADAGLEALVEVHDEAEMARAAAISPRLVGVNNRDLRTFDVDLETTRRLADARPRGAVLVSESGFSRRDELARMRGWGVDAFLIGETLMRAAEPGAALAALTGKDRS